MGVRWGRLCICPGLVLSPAHQVACPLSRPNLVSLDLGFNDLTDLQGMMASLSTLQHLRLLVLQGNPLALVPYYRGFTVDSLVGLSVLDDVTVPPSEKHQFRELSRSGGGYGRGGGPGDCPRIPTPACAHLPQTPHSTSTLVRCSVAWSGFSPVDPWGWDLAPPQFFVSSLRWWLEIPPLWPMAQGASEVSTGQ